MELLNAIHKRRSVRRFIDKKIPRKILLKIIESASWAPSACNVQGWKFILIEDNKTKKRMVEAGAASFIADAPVSVVVTYDNRSDNVEYKDHIQSASAAIQNMILAAWNHGIGCCWICHLPLKNQLRKILCIPKVHDPIACVVMGYPLQEPKDIPRKLPVEKIVCFDRFNFKIKKKSGIALAVKKLCRAVYYRIPFRKYIKPAVDRMFEKKFD